MARHLTVIDEPSSSLHSDGRRNHVHPADVSGRYTRIRTIVFGLLIAVYLITPFIQVGGKPIIFLDVINRRFHLFGASFNSNDFWLVFFLVTGVGFALIVITSLFGRVWCGYACPQTVFMEGVYRRVERLIEGNRNARIRRNAGPWNFDRIWRKVVKNGIFFVISFGLTHIFLSYFVSVPSLIEMMTSAPSEHPAAFTWVMGFTGITFFNFAWFREQVCLIVCPYGRLQSAMTDRNTFNVTYDPHRGEPRGKPSMKDAGDCVDCRRCVYVCPTGIDIRNGLQLDCIGCAACIDACDDVMERLGREPGLIRYDSPNGLEGKPAKLLRPRVYAYIAFGLLGLIVAGFAFNSRVPFEAHILRTAGAVFVATEHEVQNPVRFHLVNKRDHSVTVKVENRSDPELKVPEHLSEITLKPFEARYVPALLAVDREDMRSGIRGRFTLSVDSDQILLEIPILGPIGQRE